MEIEIKMVAASDGGKREVSGGMIMFFVIIRALVTQVHTFVKLSKLCA